MLSKGKINLCCIFENSQFINRIHSITEFLEETLKKTVFTRMTYLIMYGNTILGISHMQHKFNILDHFAVKSLPCPSTASEYKQKCKQTADFTLIMWIVSWNSNWNLNSKVKCNQTKKFCSRRPRDAWLFPHFNFQKVFKGMPSSTFLLQIL